MKHRPYECVLVRMAIHIEDKIVHGEELCDQGIADKWWDGINGRSKQ